jgi:NAD(P)-dependent dehydrogenase (short-subunit alcohol dehydrogenase family)
MRRTNNARVNSVHNGLTWTPLVEGGLKSLAEAASTSVNEVSASVAAMHPANRFGGADKIAAGILFLASDESSFMTGAELVLDGGAGIPPDDRAPRREAKLDADPRHAPVLNAPSR